MVWVRVARNAAACALPRPSATASARLAKSTVSQSHTAMSPANNDGSRTNSRVVRTEPISTTNITGLRHISRGSSLRNASGRERQSRSTSNI